MKKLREAISNSKVNEFLEDVIQREEVDEVGCILSIDALDVLDDGFGDIGEVFTILPEVVEVLQICIADGGRQTLDELEDVVASLTAELSRGELIEGHVGVERITILDI